MNDKIKRIVSIVTIGCFLFSFIIAADIQGAIEYADNMQGIGNLLQSSLIPPSIGRITDSKDFNSSTLVVNIQDLHCHSEVQHNIASIIQELDKKYKLNTVFVEGGYGDIDTSWLSSIHRKETFQQIMESLLQQGKLTGAEYYSMTTGKYNLLKGLEDERLHKENIVRLGTILQDEPRFEQTLKGLKQDLGFMQTKYFNGRNKRFNAILEQYRAGKLSSEHYYDLLRRWVRDINGNPQDYNLRFVLSLDNFPNIKLYCLSMDLHKHLRYERVARQLPRFVQLLKNRLPYCEYEALLQKTDNFKRLDVLASALLDNPGNRSLVDQADRFPDLARYIRYIHLNSAINPFLLIKEDKQLVEQLRIAFSRDASEMEVSFISDFYSCFEDYLLNKLSAEDYEYFKDRFEKFKAIWGKYIFKNRISDFAKDFPLLDEYYAVNARRNEIFLAKILREQKRIAGSGSSSLPVVIVVVAGGFHSDGLSKLLKDQKISYITITPSIFQSTRQSSITYQSIARQLAKRYSSEALALTLPSDEVHVLDVTDTIIDLEINRKKYLFKKKADSWELQKTDGEIIDAVEHIRINEAVNQAAAMVVQALPFQPGSTVTMVKTLITAFGTWGTYKGLWGGNGLIWQITVNPEVRKKLGSNINLVSQLPDILQTKVLYDTQGQLRREELSKGNNILAPLLEIPGMYEFWLFIIQTGLSGQDKHELARLRNNSDVAKRIHLQDNLVSVVMGLIGERNPADIHLLDLGSGNGSGGSLDLAQSGVWYTGVDIQEKDIAAFKEKTASNERVTLYSGHMLAALKNIESNSIDIVHAHLSLHYFDTETTRVIFSEIQRVLKPGGKFVFKVRSLEGDERDRTLWKKIDPLYSEAPFFEIVGGRKAGEVIHLFTREFIDDLLFRSKLNPLVIQQQPKPEGWDNSPWVVEAEKTDGLRDVLEIIGGANIAENLKKYAEQRDESGAYIMDRSFPGFSGLKQIVNPYGDNMFDHTFNFLKILEQLENGDYKGFSGDREGKTGPISEFVFKKYHDTILLQFKDQDLKKVMYLAGLLHDWGKTGNHLAGHEARSGQLISQHLESQLPPVFYNKLQWLVTNHLGFGPMFQGERTPEYLLKSLPADIPNKDKEMLLQLLSIVNFADIGSLSGGKFLTDEKAIFFADHSSPEALSILQMTVAERRIKMFAADGAGKIDADKKARLDTLISELPVGDIKALKGFLGRTDVFDYAKSVFNSLDAENLLKLLLLLTAAVQGRDISWVGFPPQADKKKISGLLQSHGLNDFSLVNSEKLISRNRASNTLSLFGFSLSLDRKNNVMKISESSDVPVAAPGIVTQIILDTVIPPASTEYSNNLGAATIDRNGNVHVFIRFIAGTPERIKELNIRPEDLHNISQGNMFAHTATGEFLVFVPEGQTPEEAAGMFMAAVKGLREHQGSTPLFKQIKVILNDLKHVAPELNTMDLKLQKIVPGISIVEGNGEVKYDGREMTVPISRFNSDFSRDNIAATMTALFRERAAHERHNEGKRYFSVSAQTPDDLVAKLASFRGATAGNIVIPGAVFEGADAEAIRKTGQLFTQHNINTFVNFEKVADPKALFQKDYQHNGFAGYVFVDVEGAVNIVKYDAGKNIFDAAIKPQVLKLDKSNSTEIAGYLLNDTVNTFFIDLTAWTMGDRPRDITQAVTMSDLIIDLLQDDKLEKSLKEQTKGFDPQYLKSVLSAA